MATASKFLDPHIIMKMTEAEASAVLLAVTYTIRQYKDLGDNGFNVELAKVSGALDRAGVKL